MGLTNKFLHHVVPGVIKPLRILWNEMIGFLFIVLGLLALPSIVRGMREFDGSGDAFFRVGLAVIFLLVMSYFGVSSFWRARKISRK